MRSTPTRPPPSRDTPVTGARRSRAAVPIWVGYFAPHEGSATTAYGVYNVANLAAYEAYRARLRDDPGGLPAH